MSSPLYLSQKLNFIFAPQVLGTLQTIRTPSVIRLLLLKNTQQLVRQLISVT